MRCLHCGQRQSLSNLFSSTLKKKAINQLIEILKQNFKDHRINQISKSFMYLLNKSIKGILWWNSGQYHLLQRELKSVFIVQFLCSSLMHFGSVWWCGSCWRRGWSSPEQLINVTVEQSVSFFWNTFQYQVSFVFLQGQTGRRNNDWSKVIFSLWEQTTVIIKPCED